MPDELGRSAGGSNDAPQFIQFGKSAGQPASLLYHTLPIVQYLCHTAKGGYKTKLCTICILPCNVSTAKGMIFYLALVKDIIMSADLTNCGPSNQRFLYPQFSSFVGVKTAKGQDQLKHHENKKSSVSTREAAVSSMTREDEREKMEMPLSEEITFRKTPQNREINQSRGGRGQYGRPTTEGARNYRGDTGEGSDGRGRGRGRRGRREREDCYDQGRKSESSMLSDWLEQKLTVSSNYERQQPDMGRGGEEEYWEEVWAYQESLAIAESKEQWKREEREREERAGVTRRGGWGNEGEMREGGGGRGVQGGRESETDYRSHGGRGSGTLTSQQYEDNDDGSGGGRLGQRHRFERRENEDRPRGRGGGRRGGGGGRQEHSSNEQQYYGGRERGGRERRGDDFRATGQKSEFGNNWQDQRREFFTEEFGHSKQQHYSGGRGRGVGGERGQKQSGRKDFGSRSEQPKMLERDSRTEEQAGSNEEWPSVSVSATVAAAPSSTENQQYNWGWVKKGAPLRAKKVGL